MLWKIVFGIEVFHVKLFRPSSGQTSCKTRLFAKFPQNINIRSRTFDKEQIKPVMVIVLDNHGISKAEKLT